MSVLMPNAKLGVRHRIDGDDRNSHGERVRSGWGIIVGLYDGRTNERADGGWGLGVDPRCWPVRQGDLVVATTGDSWLVSTADLIQNNYDSRVDWVRIDGLRRGGGGTQPVGAWFVARYTDYVEPVPPDGPPISAQPGLWTGNGPPPSTAFGAHAGDEYIDLASGTVYELMDDSP